MFNGGSVLKNVYRIICFFSCLLFLAASVFAVDPGGDPAAAGIEVSESTYPVVSLSPESISDLVSAISDSESVSVPDVGDGDAVSYDGAVSSAALTGSISGGYYFVCDCALGKNLKFWIPSDFASGSLAFDGNNLINMTNSSIYLLPDNLSASGYSIYAPRFGHFQYRSTSSYSDYYDLNITAVTDTNISFLQDTLPVVSENTWRILILSILVFLICVFMIFRRW